MTPENQAKDTKAAQKQKIIIGVTVVVALVVLWQFIGLAGGDKNATIESASPVASAPGKPGVTASTGNMASPSGTVPTIAAAPAPDVSLRQEKVPVNQEIAKMQQDSQAEYLRSLNKLQMLKLQREIDETKMGIATAELNRMTAEKSIADLIVGKSAPASSFEGGPSGMQSASNTLPNAPAMPSIPSPSATPPSTPVSSFVAETPYTLLSVAYQGKRWTAVLSNSGKMYTVGVGDTVPVDNSTVVGIDKQSITLKNKTKTKIIPISSTM